MYAISSADSERFFLRLLLLHVPGATSFEFLQTVDGVRLDTFKEACRRRHLLNDDAEWTNTLEEASNFKMPNQLRVLFATICLFCEPNDPLALWQKHKHALSEDHIRRDESMGAMRALGHIDCIFRQHGKTLADFDLPKPDDEEPEETCIDIEEAALNAALDLERLNREQRQVANVIIENISGHRRGESFMERAFFIDGPGGSGKTMLYNTLISYCHGGNLKVILCVKSTIFIILDENS